MKYYDHEVIRSEIRAILAGERRSHPNIQGEISIEDSLMNLVHTISETCYASGRLEVRQEIIKTLDLRHLLGLHG